MKADGLISDIERAFTGSRRAETSLRQYLLHDKFGMSREITVAEWTLAGRDRVDSTWQEIPDAEIEECDCLLAHMGADEFLYYLPAYMRYAVRNQGETDILGMTVSSLSPSTTNDDLRANAISKYAALNDAQKSVVVRFLEFVSTNLSGEIQRTAAKALNRYWNC